MRVPFGREMASLLLELSGHRARLGVRAESPAHAVSVVSAQDRRRLLLGGSLAALAAFQGCAVAAAQRRRRAMLIAPGVYVVAGSGGVADGGNLGRIGNAGFIVGEGGVIAIDTGTSYAHGMDLLAAIAEVTDQPVRLVFVTHTRPEFLFGASAFRERGIPVHMHGSTARLMASRCETCLKTLRQTVGEDAMRGTKMYKPDQEFEASHQIDLIGRPVKILYFGHSSGPGDIAVLDVKTGVLYAGGLLDAQRVPDIQDSDLAGWKQALRDLRGLNLAQIVPGHGAESSASLITSVERYLTQLETRTRALVAAGSSLLSVSEDAELPEFDRWDQYDTIHRRNAAIAFLRFERDLMFK
jgi:glyoxylase-like metal-dependent hydrolase (beta-lactamase superfamily II)